jgi:catechol 2,3-dioxygenase-like lactoylglutathione lyase family enzyme
VLGKLLLGLLGLFAAGILILALTIVLLQPADEPPSSIEFTRFLETFDNRETQVDAKFTGIAGPARLRIDCQQDPSVVSIRLNGATVYAASGSAPCSGMVEIPVTLTANNSIEAEGTWSSAPIENTAGRRVTIRVSQSSVVDLHVLSRVHYNTNVSDFAAARAFYGQLGFTTLSGFPDTNTLEMARAIGIETPTGYDGAKGPTAGGYLLHGELIGLGFMGGTIDLIEFTIPRNDEPPYPALNRLGMAKGVFYTTHLDHAHEALSAEGVRFLSAPVTRADGTRFVVFTDPDGTFYELAERQLAGEEPVNGTHLTGFGPLNINVSDFDRSLAWYQMLGYELTAELPRFESAAVARAMGFLSIAAAGGSIERKGAILTHRSDGSTIELVQWLHPFDPTPPWPVPINHLGIHRTAFSTSDIHADVASLKAQGVAFVSPVTPCCSGNDASGSIVAFYDPDGTLVELVEQPGMTQVLPVMIKLREFFGD